MNGDAAVRLPWNRYEVLSLALVIAPPVYLLATLFRLGVDTPYMDQWETAALFAKWDDGTLSFGDLWAQQNESRMPFPRLFFLGFGLLTDWNVVAEMVPAFLLALFLLFAILRFGPPCRGASRGLALISLVLPSALLFNPVQYENWLWGHQVVVFVPPACLLAGLLVARSTLAPAARWRAAGALAFVATFSFANGMLVWLLLPPALLAGDAPDPTERRRRTAIWTVVALASLALYMHGYEKPEAQPGFLEAARRPVEAMHYFLALLGSPLGQGYGHTGIEASTIFGAASLVVFAVAAVFALRRPRNDELRRHSMPWLLLGGYALGTALITTAGRAGFGVPHALSPRYTTAAGLHHVATILLLLTVLLAAAREGRFGLNDYRLGTVFAGLAVLVGHALMETASTALVRMENWRVRRLEARACLAFLEVAPNERFLAVNCYPDVAKLRERAAAIDRLGYLRPAIVRSETLATVLGAAPDPSFGKFNAFAPSEDAIRCRGTAVIPGRGEAPDAILLGWLEESGARGVVAVAQAGRKALSNRLPPSADFERTTEWECRVPLDAVPPRVRTLRAWAYDTESGRATLLPGTAAIPGR